MTVTKITKGYKATDKDMKCHGLQYVLGEWQEVKGDLIVCQNGLHFCTELAHTYGFYRKDSDRRFECEVEDVLEIEYHPGVVEKRVAQRIRLTSEIISTGDKNTGDKNTGDCNTGDCNTGDCNTGYCNTGDCNTGDWNTGDCNTGYCNTGDCNTGDWNTGYKNTGDKNTGFKNTGNSNTGAWNTGNSNTGDWNTGYKNTGFNNTGYKNTGDRNTGAWNYCNYSTGFFGSIDPKIKSFDIECEYTRTEFIDKFGSKCQKLHDLMQENNSIDVANFAEIPNITQERLNSLHQKYINLRSGNLTTKTKT